MHPSDHKIEVLAGAPVIVAVKAMVDPDPATMGGGGLGLTEIDNGTPAMVTIAEPLLL